MSSAIRVLRRKRRQSNLGTGAAVININATMSFPPVLTGADIVWTVTLNASAAVASLPFTPAELSRLQCAQFVPGTGWVLGPCIACADLGPDPDGQAYSLTFENGIYVAPTDPDVITVILIPPDSALFTSASGAPARGLVNACPFVTDGFPYLAAVHAASM